MYATGNILIRNRNIQLWLWRCISTQIVKFLLNISKSLKLNCSLWLKIWIYMFSIINNSIRKKLPKFWEGMEWVKCQNKILDLYCHLITRFQNYRFIFFSKYDCSKLFRKPTCIEQKNLFLKRLKQNERNFRFYLFFLYRITRKFLIN